MSSTASFYSNPSYVSGAGAIYAGARRQRGGSIFGAIKSIVAPLVSGIGRSLKRNVMKNAVGFASDVVGDLASGRNVKNSLINRGKERGLKTLQQTINGTRKRKVPKRLNRKQRGSGKKRPLSKRRKSKKKTSRKRRATSKSSTSAKRRRRNF